MTLATVDIVRRTGPSGSIVDTVVTGGTTRLSTSDVASPTANNPIPVPGAGTNYSFWATLRLKATANPDGHTLNNLKVYTSTSTVPSGVTVLGQAANVSTDAGYRQATGTVGTTGTQLTAGNHTGLTGAPVSIFTFTSASPKSLAGSTATTGLFGDHFVFQVGCDSTTVPASPAPANTIVFRYDEA